MRCQSPPDGLGINPFASAATTSTTTCIVPSDNLEASLDYATCGRW
jgi:hypothetical protein